MSKNKSKTLIEIQNLQQETIALAMRLKTESGTSVTYVQLLGAAEHMTLAVLGSLNPDNPQVKAETDKLKILDQESVTARKANPDVIQPPLIRKVS